MIEDVTFIHSNWMIYIAIGALVLWLVFIWKEWSGLGLKSTTFWINTVVASIAVVVLALIVLQPALPILRKNTKVVILTEGYDTGQLDSLQNVHEKLQKFTYIANRPILENVKTSDTIFVLGQGIRPFDFWLLENYKIQYIPSKSPSGIIKYTYDHQQIIGEQFQFNGIYNSPKKGNQLILEGPAGNSLDSITLSSDREQIFRLTTALKVTGLYRFSLIEKDSLGKILSRDPIPVKVENRKNLKILIENSYPTFETKYLKNYLAEMGHQVLVKSRITRGKYKYEYFNMERTEIGAFSEKNLESFDLVILDAITAKGLGKQSRNALEQAIRMQGLGLFIQPDSDLFKGQKNSTTFSFVKQKKTETAISGMPNLKVGTYSYMFRNELDLQAIHKNNSEDIVSAYQYLGRGKVGSSTLESTYELLLNGKTKEYQQLWSDILSNISKSERTKVSWKENNMLALKDQLYTFKVRTAIAEPEVKSNKGYRIALRQDIDVPKLWTGASYPSKLGWNSLSITKDTTAVLDYFVMDITSWRTKNIYDQIQKNLIRFNNSSVKKTTQLSALKPINPIGLYILFVCCMGYLWLMPKIKN